MHINTKNSKQARCSAMLQSTAVLHTELVPLELTWPLQAKPAPPPLVSALVTMGPEAKTPQNESRAHPKLIQHITSGRPKSV